MIEKPDIQLEISYIREGGGSVSMVLEHVLHFGVRGVLLVGLLGVGLLLAEGAFCGLTACELFVLQTSVMGERITLNKIFEDAPLRLRAWMGFGSSRLLLCVRKFSYGRVWVQTWCQWAFLSCSLVDKSAFGCLLLALSNCGVWTFFFGPP